MKCKCLRRYLTLHGSYHQGEIYSYEIVSRREFIVDSQWQTIRIYLHNGYYNTFDGRLFIIYFEVIDDIEIDDIEEDEIWEDISDEFSM